LRKLTLKLIIFVGGIIFFLGVVHLSSVQVLADHISNPSTLNTPVFSALLSRDGVHFSDSPADFTITAGTIKSEKIRIKNHDSERDIDLRLDFLVGDKIGWFKFADGNVFSVVSIGAGETAEFDINIDIPLDVCEDDYMGFLRIILVDFTGSPGVLGFAVNIGVSIKVNLDIQSSISCTGLPTISGLEDLSLFTSYYYKLTNIFASVFADEPVVIELIDVGDIGAGVLTTMDFVGEETFLTEILFTLEDEIPGFVFQAEVFDELPSEIYIAPLDTTYKFLEFEFSSDEGDLDSDDVEFSEDIEIVFDVERAWISANNIDSSTIRLERYIGSSTKWVPLITTMIDDSAALTIKYMALSPGFSYFSVTGEKSEVVPGGGLIYSYIYKPLEEEVYEEVCPDIEKLILDHPFVDISGHYAEGHISGMYKIGAVHGIGGTKYFMPDNNATRVALLKMALETLGYEEENYEPVKIFPDIEIDQWYSKYLYLAYLEGIVQGYVDGLFRPAKDITRAEALKIFLFAANVDLYSLEESPFNDVNNDDWFKEVVETGYDLGVVQGYGDGNFGPNDPITRGQAAIMMLRLECALSEYAYTVSI